jgi:hypothetical protein
VYCRWAIAWFLAHSNFSPNYQKQQAMRWELWLSSQLGAKVRVAAYESRAPGRFALHELRLLHPETGALIGRARMAEVQRSEGKWAIRLNQPELESSELSTAWRIAHDWFLCRPQTSSQAARIGASQLTIQSAGQSHILHDTSLTILPASEATLFSLQFKPLAGRTSTSTADSADIATTQSDTPAQWIVKRHHRQDGLKTEMQLRSGTDPLPCSLLAEVLPWLGKLGPQATFAGNMDIELHQKAWRAMLTSGHFTGVELSEITAEPEAAISGRGEMHFEHFVISQAGIELIHGGGLIESGQMTSGLFHALGDYLGVSLRKTNEVQSYGFDRCEFAVHIRQPNLHLCCQLDDAHGPLAVRSGLQWDEPLPLENVVAALASCGSDPSLRAGSSLGQVAANQTPSPVPSTWLSRQALVWLPLGDPQWQAARAQMRLSSLQSPNGEQ